MHKGFLAISALFGVLVLLILWPTDEPENKTQLPPPDFPFLTLNGESHRLSDFTGKPAALHFWATWCQPCVVEFPQLVEAATQYPDLTVIAISVDAESKSIEKFLRPLTLPENLYVVHDTDKTITYDLFRSMHYPETILIGCDFTMKGKIIGMADDWKAIAGRMVSDCAAETSDAPHPAPQSVAD